MKYNYHGDKVAICDSTGQIKVEVVSPNGIEPTNQSAKLVDDEHNLPPLQKAHNGPCFALDFFTSPSLDMLLASVGSSGTDGELKVWAFNKGFNTANNQWQVVRRHKAANSLGCVAFCPWEHGVIIVAGSVDGSLALLNCTTDDQATFAAAHDGAVNGLSWQPLRPGEESLARLVTAGSDAKVKIWRCKESALTPECELSMNGGPPHSNWVRDVDWLKSGAACGLTSDYIASVGEDKMLRIWRRDKKSESEWICVFEHSESAPQWKCSWAPNSAMLAVSCGDNQTKVFQQTAASGDMENWEVAFAGSEAAHQ